MRKDPERSRPTGRREPDEQLREDLFAGQCVLLYSKPASPGRVKTRLIGELSAQQAAELHAAFVGDVSEGLAGGGFHLRVAWALDDGEDLPSHLTPGGAEHVRQTGEDLGARLFNGLSAAAGEFQAVAAVGSDHPELELETVEDAFQHLADGADAVFGPAEDGGYYLVALAAEAVHSELFEGIPWSTGEVLSKSLARCQRLGLEVALLPEGHDVDVAADLRRLADQLRGTAKGCPRTRALLKSWGRL